MNLKSLPLSSLLVIIAGLYLVSATLAAGSWWLAQRMDWWTYALLSASLTFAWIIAKSVREVASERRRRWR
jgi:hypothetical protein